MKITFIGAGNVATHLAPAFAKAGHSIISIYSRTLEAAESLAQTIGQGSVATNNLNTILPADVYVISVVDAAIKDIVAAWPEQCRGGVIIHTSGSTPMEVLAPLTSSFGVLYPLQTFTKNKQLNVNDITCFVEANNKTTELINQLADGVFKRIETLNSEHRKLLHVAAVFACNFSNHMVALGYDILERNGINPDCLQPLLNETFQKLQSMHPYQGQTGPARRHDNNIIDEHLQMLNDNASLQTLYRLISQSIQERYA